MKKARPIQTKVITNWAGRLTRSTFGDMNSGLAKYATTFGNNPFSDPGVLTWQEPASQIDAAGAVITDLIMAGKARVESSITYLYAIGHTGRLYKIQVNDPTTYNPAYDHPVLLATISINSPTFTKGGSMNFYGNTEQIYIGHDKGVTVINFDGTSEAFIGALGSWTQNVPRPLRGFIGVLFVGNGSNLAQIDTTGTVTTYAKLSPAPPSNINIRDLDASPDGNYLQIVGSTLALPDLTSTNTDTNLISNSESYVFKWNGSDSSYTSFDTIASFSLTANMTFGRYQYTFGNDIAGSAVFAPTEKIITLGTSQPPLPNAIGSNGNLLGWYCVESYNGTLRAAQFIYGSVDIEQGSGWWRQFAKSATAPETDIIRVPFSAVVSNFSIGSSSNGYLAGIISFGKAYFSTLETSSSPTTKYKFYTYNIIPTPIGSPIGGVYETQTELFTNKIKPVEVRIYTAPLTAGNGFSIALIGPDGNAISGTSKTFTVGVNATAGDDRCWYNPSCAPSQAVGVSITNTGVVHMKITKVEIDYMEGGE